MAITKKTISKTADTFVFTRENLAKAKDILKKYPDANKRSAIMPLLFLAQEQNDNWISRTAMEYIAEFLEVPAMYVYEVAHFYTMYNKKPVGKNLIQVCRTTPCWLRGSDQITDVCKRKLGLDVGGTTVDGKFTLVEVECLGACVNAPVVQINNDYYEDLTPASMEKILSALSAGKQPPHGTQTSRVNSAPVGWQNEVPNERKNNK
jgi:NADH-quinone oxidoreductase subunit E